MKKYSFLVLIFCFAFCVAGCASVVNPYSSDFTCPQMEKGKCVPIMEAYEESLKNQVITVEEKKDTPAKERSSLEESYRDLLFERMARLLKEPKTPLLAPPKVVRVMILPYQAEQGKEFYSARYVYVVVEDPYWILQNIVSLPPEEVVGETK